MITASASVVMRTSESALSLLFMDAVVVDVVESGRCVDGEQARVRIHVYSCCIPWNVVVDANALWALWPLWRALTRRRLGSIMRGQLAQ